MQTIKNQQKASVRIMKYLQITISTDDFLNKWGQNGQSFVKTCCPYLNTLVSGFPIILLCGASVTAWCDALRSSFDEPPRSNLRSLACASTDSASLDYHKTASTWERNACKASLPLSKAKHGHITSSSTIPPRAMEYLSKIC